MISSGSITELSQTAGRFLASDTSGTSWLGSAWWQQLQPGSWRGVPFVMDAAETRTGRRVAVHEYPYRDTVWAEDLGRKPRHFAFQAFIVGDDVYQQRNAMITACEQPGPGTLVHPTLGSVECVLVDFGTTDRRERGRMVEIAFQFIISGDLQFPEVSAALDLQVTALSANLNRVSAADLEGTLRAMRIVPQPASRSIPDFAGLAIGAVGDPTRALNSVNGLQGFYGRFATGRRTTLLPASATVDSCLAGSITSREAVLSAANRLVTASGGL